MDFLSLSVANLTPSVRASTNVGVFTASINDERAKKSHTEVRCTPVELIKVLQKDPLSSYPTVAAPSKRYAEDAIKRVLSFHSSHLNTFLNAYMYPKARIPEDVLDEVRLFCGNGDCEWVHRCQRLAIKVLEKAAYAKKQQVIPKVKLDDPTSLPSLRGVLPVMDVIPEVSVKLCHFFFAGLCPTMEANWEGGGSRAYEEEREEGETGCSLAEKMLAGMTAEKVVIKNNGWKPFKIRICQTQTIVDDRKEKEEKLSVFPLDGLVEIKAGESIELFPSNLSSVLPSTSFSSFQQIIVLSVEEVFRIFITITFISLRPPQPLALSFPSCLPIPVNHSLIGSYSAPLFLQWLTYLFFAREGHTDPSISHLLLGKSVNFQVHNEGIMQVVAQLCRTILMDLPILDTLKNYWSSLKKAHKKRSTIAYHQLPPSLSSASSLFCSHNNFWWPRLEDEPNPALFYPNQDTLFPEALQTASPAVIFGLILQWLSENTINVFDSACINCDPISYLQALQPRHRGILMFVIDLCCSLLAYRKANGVTPRTLALSFASVLCKPSQSASHANSDGTSTFETYVATQQSAVSALLCWTEVFGWRYNILT